MSTKISSKAVFWMLVFFFPISLLAQKGTIKGNIKDKATNEGLIGANVVIEGAQMGSTTDLDGNFLITNVPVGTYNIVISYISYKTKKLEGINVESGKVVVINTDLEENVAQMQEVVVVAQRETYSEVSVINEIKLSSQVITGISAEQISKTQDKDAAQVMSRVPGVTIVDSRFVMIRGVNSRYNSVLINDATAPSTEIDSRAFAFDLIPSSMLDRMLIFKSGSSDLPGDFAGGVIKTYTRNHVGENFTVVSLGTGFRTNTTFKPYYYTQGSKTDFLGYDNGFRALPASFPNTDELKQSSRNSELRERAGRSLTNNFAYQERPAAPDFKLGLTLGRKFNIGQTKVSNITSLNYSNSYQAMYVERNRYFAYDPNRPIEKRFQYFDDFTSNDVRIGLLHNWTFDLPGKNRIEFRNMFNQLGENETIIRRGTDFLQRPDQDFKNYSYHYLSRAIYSGQLQGIHTLANDKAKITWVGGLNYLNRNEPDYRRFRTFRDKADRGTEAPYIMQLPPSANLFETGRFYSKLDEIAVAHGTNFEYRFSEKEENAFTIKVGYYTELRDRTFRARYVSYLYPSFFDPLEGERLTRLPLSTIFSPENIRRRDGFVIEEGTRPTDRYTATNKLYAGYIGFTIPITNRFDFSGGVRLEYNDQVLNSQDDLGKVRGGQKVTNPLYFGNLSYDITDKMLVRLAYSRTINRPEFRELAPFLYYDFNLEAGVRGNPNLRVAIIDNMDFRWEWYPSVGETVSLGGFYKFFRNPIESFLQITTESPQLTYRNAVDAYSAGAELEIKKSFLDLSASSILRYMSISLNAALIRSRVDMGAEATAQDKTRPLQGQSPYIVNLALGYNNPDNGWNINTTYNVFGARIFAVGDVNFPTIYELPRHAIDITVTKSFTSGWEVRAGIQDLLNYQYRFYQDSDVDGKMNLSKDDPIFLYKRGTLFNATVSYKF